MRCVGFVLVVLLAASSAQEARAQEVRTQEAPASAPGIPASGPGAPGSAEVPAFDILEADILQLQVAMGTGQLTARALVDYYLARIAAFDGAGPRLNAMATLNGDARQVADALDRERAEQGPRGSLHGIPLVIKDNYETIGMPTTAGSAVLSDFQTHSDARQVARLRTAGAIIIGKTNMHEFGYGITTVGSGFGATRNPYATNRNPGGSSGGTAAAVAANFAVAGMGSDTCGSIRIPAAHNNLVGLRGTQGLSSRQGIIPLSHTQDIGGPLARSVLDLALLLDATVGFDPQDPQTADSVGKIPASYATLLRPDALRGKRIGVLENLLLVEPEDKEVAAVIGQALNAMQALGATVERVQMANFEELVNSRANGFLVLTHDFKYDINAYLAEHVNAPVKSLAEILRSGKFHPSVEDNLRVSEAMDDASEVAYLAELQHRVVFRREVVQLMAQGKLDALAYPTIRRKAALLGEPQPGNNCRLSANTGLPAISVPAGFTDDGLPVGLELLGGMWREADLLAMAYALEQAIEVRRSPVLAASNEQDIW
jgi:Asp-tRNA(Asn)/Glu-tRNA(Gln) amidotransferase A subunit family amidase